MCFNYTLPSICQASGAMGGDTGFRPGLESFSITYEVSLESTLIELPNLFFKQQCPGPDPWHETIRCKFKIRQFAYFILSWCTQRRRWLTYYDSPLLFILNKFYLCQRCDCIMPILSCTFWKIAWHAASWKLYYDEYRCRHVTTHVQYVHNVCAFFTTETGNLSAQNSQ